MDLWVMVNTRAGKQRAREYGEQIREALAREGAAPRLCYTETLEQASALLEEAARRRPDLLVCCGGDGTLSQAVNRLEEQGASLPLGYIPLGTTNDFASSLGLSRDPEQAAGQILRGKVHPLDLGRLQGRRFLYVASFGAFTQSSYKTGQGWKSALGHLAYVLESLRELPGIRPCSLEVEGEGFSWKGEFIFGAVTNSTSLGGVVKLDPSQVCLDDGLLELTLVQMPQGPRDLGKIAAMLRRGKLEGELVLHRQVRQAMFSCGQAFPWSLDGEYFPGGETLTLQAQPRSLQLVY